MVENIPALRHPRAQNRAGSSSPQHRRDRSGRGLDSRHPIARVGLGVSHIPTGDSAAHRACDVVL